MSVSVPGADGAWRVIVESEGTMQIPSNLQRYRQHGSQ